MARMKKGGSVHPKLARVPVTSKADPRGKVGMKQAVVRQAVHGASSSTTRDVASEKHAHKMARKKKAEAPKLMAKTGKGPRCQWAQSASASRKRTTLNCKK